MPSPDPLRIGIAVQARMSSRRLPGKVLRPLAGKPLLAHLLDRLSRVEAVDGLVLATSVAAGDDAIERFARARNVPCHRGPLDDVASRLLEAARAHDLHAVVRISGDSPLIDPAIVSRAVWLFRDERPDLATNVFPRSFPKGQSVEVIPTAILAQVAANGDAGDREHVTPRIYRNAARFRIVNFAAASPRPTLQLSIDTEEDFRRIERIALAAGETVSALSLAGILRLADEPCPAGSAP